MNGKHTASFKTSLSNWVRSHKVLAALPQNAMILRVIDPMKHHPLSTSRANESITSRTGAALSVGAQALGSLALGALAVGALALGAVAIGRLVIGRARIRRVEIDELVVRQLRVTEDLSTPDRSVTFLPERTMVYQETFVQRNQHRIYVRDHPGAEPTIVVMHGFPDNLHLYDRLLPHLSPPRRVVAFDFLGWGNSDKPPGYPYRGQSSWRPRRRHHTTEARAGRPHRRTTPRARRPSTGHWPTPSAWKGWCC